MARTVAVGEQDFSKIIEKDYFYIDKTSFIKKWWEGGDAVTLITRPRRFGKTLTMHMINCFFSNRYAGRHDLFENLKIWNEETYRKQQGTFPVIFLSFANVKGSHFQTARKLICQQIVNLFEDHTFLIQNSLCEEEHVKFFKRITIDMDDSDAALSIGQLSRYLYQYYHQKVIILLDEYDTPMQEAWINGYWDEMAEFIRGLFNAAFKTNPYIERGLMTGITRVSKESIFSDLNNLEVVTTTSEKYASDFGFTEKEVFLALKEFCLENKQDGVKCWYDGFCFGSCKNIYNPWSIIQFLDKRDFAPYWANTSSNQLVNQLIQGAGIETKTAVEDLLDGRSIYTALDAEVVFNDLNENENAIWSLLLASGYLKIVESIVVEPDWGKAGITYKLALTNREIVIIFQKMVHAWFSGGRCGYNDFLKALLSNHLKEMNVFMNKVALETISMFDAGKKPSDKTEPERFYHGFVLGLIVDLRKQYTVMSNRESGYGRYDILMVPLESGKDAIIMEFKVIDPEKEKDLRDTVNAALCQIIRKEYAKALKSQGISEDKIRIYGLAFRGKEVLIDGGYLSEYQ